MPKSTHWWRTNLSSSSNVPSSRRRWTRSRAVSLPALCSRSRRSGPPPASASAERRRSSSRRSCFSEDRAAADDLSGNGSSRRGCILPAVDAHGKVRSQPNRSEKQDYAKKQLCGDGQSAGKRRFDRGDVNGCAHQSEHGREGHRQDEDGGQEVSKNRFHGTRFTTVWGCWKG